MITRGFPRRSGQTLAELVVVLTITGLAVAVGVRQVRHWLDRIATHDAVRAAGGVVERARDESIALHTFVSVRVDTGTGVLHLQPRGLPASSTPVGALYGVRIATTRDSITFDMRGLGYGAANLTLEARRGSATDTLTVSRLGRVRY